MKRQQAVMMLAIFLSIGPKVALAADYQSYVDPKLFGDCVAAKLNQNGGKSAFDSRIKDAKAFQNSATHSSPMIESTLQHLNFVEKEIYISSSMASLPLIEFNSPNAINLQKEFNLEQPLFDAYQESSNVPVVDRSDLEAKILTYQNSSNAFDATKYLNTADIYVSAQQRAASMANPLVIWLLKQGKGSVSHWALLNFATGVYGGDVLTALGVTGEMFWQETLHVQNRNEQSVLASKMKPLVTPASINPVGDNYHFWQILTAAYMRGGTLLGRIYSPFDSSDPGHLLANKLGLDVADESFAQIGESQVACSL